MFLLPIPRRQLLVLHHKHRCGMASRICSDLKATSKKKDLKLTDAERDRVRTVLAVHEILGKE